MTAAFRFISLHDFSSWTVSSYLSRISFLKRLELDSSLSVLLCSHTVQKHPAERRLLQLEFILSAPQHEQWIIDEPEWRIGWMQFDLLGLTRCLLLESRIL